MIQISNSKYISLGYINRLNRKLKDTPFLINLRNVLREALLMEENGEFDSEKLHKKFNGKKWVKNINPKKPMLYSGSIMPKLYLEIQDILHKETGKVWPMNEFIQMLMLWFIYCYENDKELPIKRRKISNIKLIKFNKFFKRFYKNIFTN